MKATAELQVIPLGSGVSARRWVTRAVELLREQDLLLETHASGTDIEGELDVILAAVNPGIAPESGIFPERFLSGLAARARVDVIHRLADRVGEPGEKIPGKAG